MHFDYDTKNKSFVDMANYLKRRGIKNYNFMLTLHDYDLYGVDPYDPDLTHENQIKVIKEVCSNIWYYLREIVKVSAQGGGYRSFELNLSNMAQVFLFLHNTPSWITAPRCCSMEIDTAALLSWPRLSFSTINTIGAILNNSVYSSQRIHFIVLTLPSYLRWSDCCNLSPSAGNFRSPTQSENYGRALTQDIVWANDAEYIKNIDRLYSASFAARKRIHDICGDYNCMLFTSLVSDDDYGANEILNDAIEWKEEYFDGIPDEYLSWGDSIPPLFHIQYSYEQLGKDQNWFDNISTMLYNDEDIIRRELLMKRKTDNSDK